jgi:anti-sigma-K factor RskA
MNCRDAQEILNDYVDGTLPAGMRDQVAEHLEQCPKCKEELERLQTLLEKAQALPASIMPEHDLWPGIEDRIIEEENRASFFNILRVQPLWSIRNLAAAAAILVIVFSATYFTVTIRDKHGSRLPALSENSSEIVPVSTLQADYSSAEAEYVRATLKLQEVLDSRKQYLAPQTREVMDRNIKIINEAMAEIKKALGNDPGNKQLNTLLLASYQNKVEVMYWAAKLSASDIGRP